MYIQKLSSSCVEMMTFTQFCKYIDLTDYIIHVSALTVFVLPAVASGWSLSLSIQFLQTVAYLAKPANTKQNKTT